MLKSILAAILLLMPVSAYCGTVSKQLAIAIIKPSSTSAGTLTLTNGPPNIPYAAGGSCTRATCTWIQAGVGGEPVSDVYLDMVPMSQNYAGSFTLSGPGASNYLVATSSDGTRSVGHITTAAALSAGDDDVMVSANGVSQRLTIHKVSGTASACSEAGLNSASTAAGANGIVTIPRNCTITLSGTFSPAAAGQVFIGTGGSVISGAGVGAGSPGQSNISLMNLAVTGAADTGVNLGTGWLARNLYVHDNNIGMRGAGCGANALNNQVLHNSYTSFVGQPHDSANSETDCGTASSAVLNIVGNEVGNGGYSFSDSNADAGNKWIGGSVYTLNLTNNYIHNEGTDCWWSDSEQNSHGYGDSLVWNVSGNTFIGCFGNGLHIEQTGQPAYQVNVYQNFFKHNSDGSTACGNTLTSSCVSPQQELQIIGSSNVNVHDNNFVQANAPGGSAPSMLLYWAGEGGNAQHDDVLHNNTITFESTSPAAFCCGPYTDISFGLNYLVDPTNTGAYGNHYHFLGDPSFSGQHFWYSTGPQTLAQWQATGAFSDTTTDGGQWLGTHNCTSSAPCSSRANPDTAASGGAATVDTSASYEGAGCTHVACSSAGVGSDGNPIIQ